MAKDIQAYFRWLNGMIKDEDERKEMKVEKYADGGAKVLNSDGEVMLDAAKQGDTWKVSADDGLYDEEYSLGNSENWTPEQAGAYKLMEQVLDRL